MTTNFPGAARPTAAMTSTGSEPPRDSHTVMQFKVGPSCYCFPVSAIQEVAIPSEIHGLSMKNSGLLGMMRLREALVPVFSARMLMDYQGEPDSAKPVCLVLVHPAGPVAVLVDEVLHVEQVSAAALQRVPTLPLDHMVTGMVEISGVPTQFLSVNLFLKSANYGAAGLNDAPSLPH
ncbi:chemotaxis protein CheW [Nostoc sp. CHAB 5834]|nr:chemotaxis protein CheW [Nostoc sp. CHAB 5834]